MIIKEVETVEEADRCDELLNKLLQDEIQYNYNLNPDFVIKDFFRNVYKDENRKVFIAIVDNKIVGYGQFRQLYSYRTDIINKEALVDGIYVEEEYRNQGIGTKLIDEIKKLCNERDIKILNVNVMKNNADAYKLYLKEGFSDFSINLRIDI